MARTRKKPADEQSSHASPPQSSGDTTAASPDRDRIAARAYELYKQRGGRDGADLEDWLAAERELGGVDAAAFGTTPGGPEAPDTTITEDSKRKRSKDR